MNPQTNHLKISIEKAEQNPQTGSILKKPEIFVAIRTQQRYIATVVLK